MKKAIATVIFSITGSMILLLASVSICLGQSVWEKVVLPPGAQAYRHITDVAHTNGTFVAMGGGELLTSPDGRVWTAGTPGPFSFSFHCLASGNGHFVALSGTSVYESVNGSSWSQTVTNGTGGFVAFCNGQFMIMGRDTVMTSPDGTVWTKTYTGIHATISSMTYGAGRYVALAWRDTVLTSSNGTTWTAGALGRSVDFNSVAFGKGKFVAVGGRGSVLTSPDGLTWTPGGAGTNRGLGPVIFANNLFVSASSNAVFYVSPDGVAWTPKVASGMLEVYGMAYGNSRFVAVGREGGDTILISDADAAGVIGSVSGGAGLSAFKVRSANGTIVAGLPNHLSHGWYRVEIFSAAGKRIHSSMERVDNEGVNISVPKMGRGVHILSIADKNGRTVSSSFFTTR